MTDRRQTAQGFTMATPSQLEHPFVEELLKEVEEYIPEMDPGTVYLLKDQARLGDSQNPFVAVMTCPRCGTPGLITRRQLYAGERMICGGDACSAEYFLDGNTINYRPAQ
jgi:hypothetical protein